MRSFHPRSTACSSLVGSALVGFALAAAAVAEAAPQSVRYTRASGLVPDLAHALVAVDGDTGLKLTEADFRLGEDRPLAFGRYQRFDQVAGGVRVAARSVRIWTGTAGELVQIEAAVEAPTLAAPLAKARGVDVAVAAAKADVAARKLVLASEDARLRSLGAETVWEGGRLVRVVTAKAQRGVHVVRIELATQKLVASDYAPYANGDLGGGVTEYSVPALVYPIYEDFDGTVLERQRVELTHLLSQRPVAKGDLYAPLRARQYLDSKNDPVKGETPEGQAEGYWTMRWLREQADALAQAVPLAPNVPGAPDAVLYGRYATIDIHPALFDAYPGVTLPKHLSTHLLWDWLATPAGDDYELVPVTAFTGHVLASATDALDRPATRDPQNDPAVYANEGFDEVQVYYAVNQLFESLRPRGFTDPDLGDRPFHAYLFNPDIESRDNAFYTDDTINFTTYSPGGSNMARDNTTIWHELGHGVMDRLMGDQLRLADTGGLSEGMADFVAQLVLGAVNGVRPFPGSDAMRIVNSTGFFLTNEVHDDGEAYGGTMKAILDGARASFGDERGLAMVTDLVLEAMRLSRDHPGLTAQDWFDHVLYADELGRKGVREPGELRDVIQGALASRNFASEATRAQMHLSYRGEDVVAGGDGSRGHEIRLELAADATSTHVLHVALHDGDVFKFKYPVEVRVFFNSGPLQGAIDWEGEDAEPKVLTIAAPGDEVDVPVTVRGQCDAVNRTDGTCSDFAYVQIVNAGETRPVAKKRFYLRIKTL
jgi:hypothetical protein